MKRRTFLSTLSVLGTLPVAGCSTTSTNTSTTSTPTPSPTPTPTPEPSPTLTSVSASQVRIYGKLNPLMVTIHYANLDTPKRYSIRFVTESDAGTKTKTHVIQRQQGIYPGITGFRADAPEGTATDGTANLSYTAILREEGTKMDTEEGVIISYE